jgi:hypothetical protein
LLAQPAAKGKKSKYSNERRLLDTSSGSEISVASSDYDENYDSRKSGPTQVQAPETRKSGSQSRSKTASGTGKTLLRRISDPQTKNTAGIVEDESSLNMEDSTRTMLTALQTLLKLLHTRAKNESDIEAVKEFNHRLDNIKHYLTNKKFGSDAVDSFKKYDVKLGKRLRSKENSLDEGSAEDKAYRSYKKAFEKFK